MGTANKVKKNPQNTVSCPSPNNIQIQNIKVKLASKIAIILDQLLANVFLSLIIIKEAVQNT